MPPNNINFLYLINWENSERAFKRDKIRRTGIKKELYTIEKKAGLEWLIAIFTILEEILKMKATKIIKIAPFSFRIDLNGEKKPDFIS